MKKLSKVFIAVAVLLVAGCALGTFIFSQALDYSPGTPELVKAQNVDGGTALTWESVRFASGYRVYRISGEAQTRIADINNLTYTDKAVKSGASYTYFVKAYNRFGEGEASAHTSNVYLAVPAIKNKMNRVEGIYISWNASPGAEGYSVYRKSSGTSWVRLASVGSTARTYIDGVNNGDEYYYAVRAYSGKYLSAYVGAVRMRFVTSPELIGASNGNGCIEVKWNSVSGVDGYKVLRKVYGTDKWTAIGTFTGKSCRDTTAKSSVMYQYAVKAFIGSSESAYRPALTVKCIGTPVFTYACNAQKAVELNWKAVDGAWGYIIYRRTGGDSKWSTLIKTNSGTVCSYSDTNIENGKTYAYRIRSYNGTAVSGCRSAGIKYKFINYPSVTSLTNSAGGMKIQWTRGKNTNAFVGIYRKANGSGSWQGIALIKNASQLTYIDKTAKSGVNYTYTVKHIAGDYSSWYSRDGVSRTYLASPGFTVSNSPKGVTLKWGKISGSTSYLLYRQTAGEGKWTKIATVKGSATSYVDKSVKYRKVNYYMLRAYAPKNCGAYSASRNVWAINPNKPVVALTYDDGPYAPVTNHILDVMQKHNVRATFFVVGSRLNSYSDELKREAKLGCEIGNHTYNHTSLTSASKSEITSELNKTSNLVKKLTGQTVRLVRAPGGGVNSTVKQTVKYPLINWSVDTRDWDTRSCSKTVASIKNDVFDGAIVLMHDLYTSSGDATEIVVPWLIDKGYQIVTVSEMMRVRGVKLENGTLYRTA